MIRISIIALLLMLGGARERLKAEVIFVDIEDITLGNPTEYVYTDLDLNSDGIADATFQTGRSDLVCFSTVGGGVAGIPTVPPNQNHFAAAFSSGEIIGISFPTESLYRWNDGYSGMLSCRDAGCLGLWEDKTAFLGVQFASTAGAHYGWVEVFVFGNTSTGSILSYAYESEPGRAIVAEQIPEPSGIMLTAAGLAIGHLRRRRKGRANHAYVSISHLLSILPHPSPTIPPPPLDHLRHNSTLHLGESPPCSFWGPPACIFTGDLPGGDGESVV